MNGVKLYRDKNGVLSVERFPLWRRIEHIVVIATFTTLVLTGFPQKFYDTSWAASVISALGGLADVRTVHRIAGFLFTASLVMHVAVIVFGALTRRMRMTLVPVPQDLRDAWQNLRYYFGLREHPPKMPVFDYRQKFEYIGMVLGSIIMAMTGLFLIWPVEISGLLGGEAIAASRLAHSNEAVLALLVLIIWHAYSAVLAPDVFPLDKSMFTGKMTVAELKHHHALEYDRLFPDGDPEAVAEAAKAAAKAHAEAEAAAAASKPPLG